MNSMQPADRPDLPGGGERLSSVVDGECPPGDVDDACRRWRSDGGLQHDWRLYHLIGDVLRSDELSPTRADDQAFLDALRQRLAREPVPLAPAPLAAARPQGQPVGAARGAAPVAGSTRRLSVPAAVAAGLAGVVVVGSAVVMMRQDPARPGATWGEQMVAAPGALPRGGSVDVLAVGGATPAPAVLIQDGHMLLRDPRLDAYIEAHRGALAPLPVAMPGAALRSVDIRAAAR